MVVSNANFTMPLGSLIAKVINRRSFTSGNDTNDESHIAKTIKPNPPYGNRVFLSQIEIASKFIDRCYWGSNRLRSRPCLPDRNLLQAKFVILACGLQRSDW